MKHIPCRQCQFWVNRRDVYCPNCGSAQPATPQSRADWYAGQQTLALLAICMCLALAVGIASTKATVARIVLSGFVVFGGGLYYGIMSWKTARLERVASASLRQKETVITQRLAEIPVRQQNLETLLQPTIADNDPAPSETLVATINQAIAALHAQHRQYRLKLWEIAVIRWSNTLRPLIEGWEQLTPEGCHAYLQEFSHIAERGQELLQEWHGIVNGAAREKSGHAPLEQALTAIQKLRKALQSRQVALAVQGISQFEDASGFFSTAEMLDELAIFNTLTDLHQFSSGFQALEEAYCRLKSEEELSA
jgi:hypothetical protein